MNISASSEKVNQETDSSQDKPRSRQPSESKSHPVPVTQGIEFLLDNRDLYGCKFKRHRFELNWPIVSGKNWYIPTFY